MILVTGGTGLVGSHLLFQLVKKGASVKAIYRREQTLQRVKHVFSYFSSEPEELFNAIDWIKADITNISELQVVFKDVTHVYHCAAFVSFEPDKYRQLRAINIRGTANIVNLCINNKIKKLCYVSSIAALGRHNDAEALITEDTRYNPDDDNSVYAITKYGAELEIWRGTQEGVDAVILNPGIILGAGFWHGAGSSSLFKRAYKGLKFYVTGVTGYVNVWDVVAVMQELMESTIKNEAYILVAENLSFKTFFEKVSKALHVEPPKRKTKKWQLQVLWRLDWLTHKLLGKRRQLTRQTATSLLGITTYDNSKIKKALDFEFISIDDTIKDVSQLFLNDFK